MMEFKKGVNAAKAYIKQQCPDAILLDNVAVSASFVATLDTAIDNAAVNNTPTDLLTTLPATFDKADIRKLLTSCNAVTEHKNVLIIFDDCFVVSKKVLDDVVQAFQQKAKTDIQKLFSNTSATNNSNAAKQKKAVDDDDEDDSRRGKKKAGGKKKPTKKTSDDADQDNPEKADMITPILPKKVDVLKKVETLFGDNMPTDDAVIEELVDYIQPLLRDMYDKFKESIFLDAASENRKVHQYLEKLITDLNTDIALHTRAIEVVKSANKSDALLTDMGEQLQKHLLRTKATELVHVLIRQFAVQHHLDHELPKLAVPSESTPSTPITPASTTTTTTASDESAQENSNLVLPSASLKVLFSKLPGPLSKSLSVLLQALQKGWDAFQQQLTQTTTDCNVYFKPYDKKKEKYRFFVQLTFL